MEMAPRAFYLDPSRWDWEMTCVSAREGWIVFAGSVGLALLAILPYLYGYLTVPGDRYYLGSLYNATDQNTYFMWLTQVAAGKIFLKNLYTSIPHDGAMLNLFFLLFGLPARLFGWSLDACYQLARICSSVALGMGSYAFVALFFRPGPWRWASWSAVLFSAGIGWLVKLMVFVTGNHGGLLGEQAMVRLPIDTWIPEAFPWFSLLVIPHFTMALSFLLVTLRWLALGILSDRLSTTGMAGGSLFLLSFVHPYDVIVCCAIAFGVAFVLSIHQRTVCWQLWRHVLLSYAIGAPPIVYNYLILHLNPGMRAWLVQNISHSPGPLSYLLGFGLPLVLATVWLVAFLRHSDQWSTPWLLIAVWILLAPFMLYGPIAFQRRLVIGLSAPLAVAMMALVSKWVRQRPWPGPIRVGLVGGLIAVASLTNLFHFLNGFYRLHDRSGENYISQAQVEALEQIRRTGGRGTVLSSFATGNAVPRFSGLPAVIGSRGQTGHFNQVLQDVGAFYAGAMSTAERNRFLEQHRVEFIYYGPKERQMDRTGMLEMVLAASGWQEWTTTGKSEVKVFRRPLNP